MIHPPLLISTFDIYSVDDESMLAYADHFIRYYHLILPEDPDLSREAQAKMIRTPPAFIRVKDWAVWNEGRIIAHASAFFDFVNENDRTMWHQILVEPAFRRRGVGRRLLEQVYAYARETGRTVLQTQTLDRDLDGVGFLEHVGEKRGMEMRVNQLDLQQLDHRLLGEWLERGVQQNPDISLGFWENEIPEGDLEQMAELIKEIQRTAPHDDLEIPEPNTTPETVRQILKFQHDRGNTYLVAYLRDHTSGGIAGYSEVTWHPEQATILNQYASLVRTAYRNHGLGRLLKAGMLQHVQTRLPEVRFIRTSNSHSNAPMLKINEELGFHPYMAQIFWQAELADLQPYLKKFDE